jgi:hypothetical protein
MIQHHTDATVTESHASIPLYWISLQPMCRFLETVQKLLGEVDQQTNGQPECASLLSEQKASVAAAIADCKVWTEEHRFFNAPRDKVGFRCSR